MSSTVRRDTIKNHVGRGLHHSDCAVLCMQHKYIRGGKGEVFMAGTKTGGRGSGEEARQRRAGSVLTRLVLGSATPRAWLRAHSRQQCWNRPAEDKEGAGLLLPSLLSRLPLPSFKLRWAPGLAWKSRPGRQVPWEGGGASHSSLRN